MAPMTDATLRDLVLKRLEAETQPKAEWSALFLAALLGVGSGSWREVGEKG
jgi:hypothetical protein